MNKDYLIGVDVGGTTIKAGLIDINGKITNIIEVPTEARKGRNKVIDNILYCINRVKKGNIIGVGVGVPGPVDYKRGTMFGSPNKLVSCLKNVNIKQLLEKNLNLPVYIDNDANCFLLGEYKSGVAKKIENVVGLTLGTGIGGAIIANGKLYRGAIGTAGEFCHMVVVEKGLRCGCGNKGCLEMYASGTGIIKRYQKLTGKRRAIPEIVEQAKKNKKIRQIIREAGYYLGIALANIVNILNPDMIVIGGGIANIKTIVPDAVREMKKRALPANAKYVRVIQSRQEDAAIIGAASIVFGGY